MTTKLNFIKAACITFNCTHSTVLAAVTGRASAHPETCAKIKEAAENSCNATQDDWKAFAAAVEPGSIGDKFLWSITTGAELVL